ncbi:TrbC/VirB2 family protein [Shimia marina]|uniref:Type IV secretion system protein virB2 n=1 Tax=Shimia marina TaxID=321267 RepID=A0A0P1EQH1_9RHOB|nr:TrbC/VirB2 family protein [Shimia marina]CUH52675.1 Type IV secretion system protein virB2 precursor [Shimia marina]SFE75063.1 type IV secretion system protein VirB2 [Shimia marina]
MRPNTQTFLTLALACFVFAEPALAQSIDLSPVKNLLQGIVDTITGPLGIVIGTLALIGVFLSWLFGILDFRQALWVLVAIAGIAAAPTIVTAIWST